MPLTADQKVMALETLRYHVPVGKTYRGELLDNPLLVELGKHYAGLPLRDKADITTYVYQAHCTELAKLAINTQTIKLYQDPSIFSLFEMKHREYVTVDQPDMVLQNQSDGKYLIVDAKLGLLNNAPLKQKASDQLKGFLLLMCKKKFNALALCMWW